MSKINKLQYNFDNLKKTAKKFHPSSSAPMIGSFRQLLSETCYIMVYVQILLYLLSTLLFRFDPKIKNGLTVIRREFPFGNMVKKRFGKKNCRR